MRLAKDKNGRIGRQLRSNGIDAVIQPSQMGERRGQLYLSSRSIEDDQNYYEGEANKARSARETKAVQAFAKRKAEQARDQVIRAEMMRSQRPKSMTGMNEKFKRHYTKLAGMTESERVTRSIKADFHMNEEVPGQPYGRNPDEINWRSDFRQRLVTGNVLTRDGQFGPVTDYERFVDGDELVNQRALVPNQTPVVLAGGTMAGRYRGKDVPVKVVGRNPYAMGDEYDGLDDSAPAGDAVFLDDWANDPSLYADTSVDSTLPEEDISVEASDPSFWDKLYAGATSGLQKQIPTLEAQAIAALKIGGKVTQKGNTITIQTPGKPATTINAGSMLPVWLKYSAFGLLGLGALMVGIKLVKK